MKFNGKFNGKISHIIITRLPSSLRSDVYKGPLLTKSISDLKVYDFEDYSRVTLRAFYRVEQKILLMAETLLTNGFLL